MEYYLLLVIPLILVVIILYRTFSFKPSGLPEMKKKHDIDEKRVVESLSKMIQFKTISYADKNLMDDSEFIKFRKFLKDRYPLIFGVAEYSEHFKGMLIKIKGESMESPTVFMSHYDVVPVNGTWQEDPFSGRINEKTVYGRGTLDTKSSLNAVMESVEFALSRNKVFKNDLYLAFGGDEETYGVSASTIVKYFKEHDIKPAFVLDEGGAIVSKMFPGVDQKAAVVGIAEKGFLNLKLVAKSTGGHASTPPKDTPLTDLSKAVTKLNNHPSFRLKLTPPVKSLFEHLAPHSKSFMIKMLFSNLWIFSPLVKLIAKLSGGEFLSLFKTTQAFTMSKGSEAINVLPSRAEMGVNYRLRPFESSTDVVKRVEKIIHNKNISVEVVEVSEATSVSLIDDQYKIIEKAIKQTWPEVIPSPYLMIATSDSRHYHSICDHVYKFSPMDVSKADLAKIHGLDEDISIENVINGVNFYLNIIDQL
ncbi:MAG: M20/M25/M40 family metallo-hydrolase [Acholeplasmataceae bacterium]|jgi:carboxypeptidase PM20D1|nr:M20/M25/M40 family metallo-hydrolase [Acholeplasmataceae bacterium]